MPLNLESARKVPVRSWRGRLAARVAGELAHRPQGILEGDAVAGFQAVLDQQDDERSSAGLQIRGKVGTVILSAYHVRALEPRAAEALLARMQDAAGMCGLTGNQCCQPSHPGRHKE